MTTTTRKAALNAAIASRPAGTSAMVVAPWAADEVYGVAARWADAAAPVWTYGPDEWQHSGHQVADYRHSPSAALAAEIAEAIQASGDDVDEEEVAEIISHAIRG